MSSKKSLVQIVIRFLAECRDFFFPPDLSRLGSKTDGALWIVKDESSIIKWHVPHVARLSGYTAGVASSVERLSHDYRLENLEGVKGEFMVDVGANVGLLGKWATDRGWGYLGIEPDPRAFEALRRNLPDASLENCAVGAEEGIARFWVASATADSSLIEPESSELEIEIAVRTLDTVVDRHFPEGEITLLKIEAEGAEPEVLTGAKKTIARTAFVAVDAGPERQGKITAPAVLNILFDSGFEMVDAFLARGTFLLRRRTRG